MSTEELFYTYIDECKKNYLTQIMKDQNFDTFQEYSITSLTFPQKCYKDKLEIEWNDFCNKYRFAQNKALHFVDFRKLVSATERLADNPMYSYFEENGIFSEEKLKSFFKELRNIIMNNEFFIVHTDYYWKKSKFLAKRNKFKNFQLTNEKRNIAPAILNAVPYVAMKKHLDSLLLVLLQNNISGQQNINDGYYFDEMLPNKIYTKLRFDADGKEFDARTDIKKAYYHTVSVGSDNVKQTAAVEILDEIRFIRKEEVGFNNIPNHCGLEIVDFLCSMIAGETRLEAYKKEIPNLSINSGTFLNIKFDDNDIIEFYEIVMEKLRRKTITYLNY